MPRPARSARSEDHMADAGGEEKAQRGIQSVEVGGRFLRALADVRAPMALAELAASVQIAPAQAHTYLVSLVRLGLIKRDHLSGRYEPGPLALQLGMLYLDHDPAYRAAVPRVAALAGSCGFSVAICAAGPQGPTIVRYAHAGSPLHVNLHVGTVMSLSATATGRVFCAFLPPGQWQAIWAQQHAGDTPAVDATAFAAELAAIRERGIERSIDAPSPAVSSLCVPVLDASGRLRLALTVVGSTGAIDVGWRGPVAVALLDTAAAIRDAIAATTEAE
ncbi:IclR family transcriptional regulator [Cupriavidus basilensis]|uniref:IclR family transcriptional regulator n=2 Tax=Cupriavidus basilensis TaxID=68895 RepID=UPI0035A31FB8